MTMTAETPAETLTRGTRFAGRYEIIEELGTGGMGSVFRAEDTKIGQEVAIKIIRPEIASSRRTIERFRNEIKTARMIAHRNVCRMFDLGEEKGVTFITMEYVAGEDLKSFLRRAAPLSPGRAVSIAIQALEGLAEAHRLGVVHRDLKPGNIMIDKDGNARIMDFGIARATAEKGITGPGVMIGTPEYMSPEQAEGMEADPRSDIYSLGVVLFEMLTGRVPFEGDTPLGVAVKQKTEPPPDPRTWNAQIPEKLGGLILKCLEKAREKRYPSAEALLADLGEIEKAMPTATTAWPLRKQPTSKQITVRVPSKRVWIPAAAVLLALAVLLAWQLIPEREGAKRAVAVLGFKNQTGDPNLDYLRETISNLLITSLEQSKYMRVASWQRLRDLFRQAGRDESALYDEEAGLEVCRREGIDAVVVGFFSRAGETFVSDVKVLDVQNRELLKSASARGEGVNSILKSQVDEISRAVSRGVGRPALKLDKPQTKIIDLTTDSIEAYGYFLRGRDAVGNLMGYEAKKLLEKAITLDPDFAVAYLYLYEANHLIVDYQARDEALKKAKELSARASEKERLYIEAKYASRFEGDPAKGRRLLQELTEKYPQEKYAHYELGRRDYAAGRFTAAVPEFERALALDPAFGPALNMLGYALGRAGDYAKAETAFERYIASNPGDPNPVDSLGELYVRMGRLDKAEAKYRQALDIKPDFVASCGGLAYLFALRENYAETSRWLAEYVVRAGPTEKMAGLWMAGYYDYFLGRLEKARSGYLDMRKMAESFGAPPYIMAALDFGSGTVNCETGRFEESRRAFESYIHYLKLVAPAEENSNAAESALSFGWVDLKQGRLDDARARLAEAGRFLPKAAQEEVDVMSFATQDPGSLPFFYRLLAAEIALAGGSPAEAVSAAEEVQFLDFPGMNPDQVTRYNYPVQKDVLARACWKSGNLERAVAEYRKLMTVDPSNQVRYLIHPLYHYRLGRVLEEEGDKQAAADEFRKFLDYWKDADPGLPELEDARNRLARF
jgi:serine/threonine protein kinase/Flp pilus assembly protein TadD